MIFRFGFFVAVSIAAYAIGQLRRRTWSSSILPTNHSGNGEDKDEDALDDEDQKVNAINYAIDRVNGNPNGVDDEDGLHEFGDLSWLSDSEHLLLNDDKSQMENNMIESERLLKLVMILEEKQVELEGELLTYHGLKDRKSDIAELREQLKIKNEDINMLNIAIVSLQAENKKLQEKSMEGMLMKMELGVFKGKIKELQRQRQLQANQTKEYLLLIKQQVSDFQAKEEEAVKKEVETRKKLKSMKGLQTELEEFKRKNQELRHEKQELSVKLAAMEAKITGLTTMAESKMVTKEREEAHNLSQANEDLIKQIEGLQRNRFSEVEELVYLRWVNACLRYELRNYQTPLGKVSACDLNKRLSPNSKEIAKQLMLEYAGIEVGEGNADPESNISHPFSSEIHNFDDSSTDTLMSNVFLKELSRSIGGSSAVPSHGMISSSRRWEDPLEVPMPPSTVDSVAITTSGMIKQEISEYTETLALSEVRRPGFSSDSLNLVAKSFQMMSISVQESLQGKYPAYKDLQKLAIQKEKQIKEKYEEERSENFVGISSVDINDEVSSLREGPAVFPSKLPQIRKKATASHDSGSQYNSSDNLIINSSITSKVRSKETKKMPSRVPRPPPRPSEGGTFSLHSPPSCMPDPQTSLPRLMTSGEKVYGALELAHFKQSSKKQEAKKCAPVNARRNIIEEIENRSSFILAVKADVDNQRDLVMSLAKKVRTASFSKMEDVISFVIWLDKELSFLVDERAVLNHFDWPEGKTDALREAAYEYQELMKLEEQVSSFVDNPKLTCEVVLKKMYSLQDKMEQSVYMLNLTRDTMIAQYKEFQIPVDWLLDSAVLGKIKLVSVQLVRKCLKHVVREVDALNGPEKEQNKEMLLLQGIRFAFRVHQFVGGFDAESMEAFEELQSCVHMQVGKIKQET